MLGAEARSNACIGGPASLGTVKTLGYKTHPFNHHPHKKDDAPQSHPCAPDTPPY